MFIFLFCFGITSVFAKTPITQTLNLTTQTTEDNLDDEGWSWNSDTKTLILKDANFEVNGNDPCIILQEGDVTVIFEGENTLKAEKGTTIYADHNSNLTLKSENNGILNLEVTTPDGTGGNNLGNTIQYTKDLIIESGTINSTGGIFVDGTVTINGGNLNIDTKDKTYRIGDYIYKVGGIHSLSQVIINGGNVNINSNTSSIQVTGAPNYRNENGVIINGGNLTLTTNSENTPTIHTGALSQKNIEINGGDITLAGDYGMYSANGTITVNHFDNLNTENVQNNVFKVSEDNPNNKIVYAPADYSKVDEAIAKANSLNKSDYKDFSNVEAAINSVIRDKNILEQSEVDAMADAINKAINDLELNNKITVQNVTNPNTYDSVSTYIISFILSIATMIISVVFYKKNIKI